MGYDAVVVGAGMFGSSIARSLADRGKKVLLLEKRHHVGGMCHTQIEEGIVVHKYGPHVFHTNDHDIWAWINRFSKFDQFSVRTKAVAGGKLWSFPVNLMTLYQLWGVKTPEEAEKKLSKERLQIESPSNFEDWVLSVYGREIYELFYAGYTWKQWGRDPSQLPAAIAQRLPHRLTFEDNYFRDRFQGIPSGGYGPMFDRMLEGVEVRTNTDFHSDRETFGRMGKVIYSGRIDEFFDYRFGDLEFRTCRFETESFRGDFQGNPVINYCDRGIPWTRIVEHKHFGLHPQENTIITKEHPMECDRQGTPLYPINDEKNSRKYRQYAELKTDAIIGGRLGSYRYFDMCEVIAQAWKIAEQI